MKKIVDATSGMHLGTMSVKVKRETDGTFILHVVYCNLYLTIKGIVMSYHLSFTQDENP